MRRRLFAIALAVLIAGGCTRPPAPPPEQPPAPAEPPPENQPAPAPTTAEVVNGWLAYLTLAEKVGQMLWVGLEGQAVDARAEALLGAGKAGGVVLFTRNGTAPVALRALTDRLQATVSARDRFTPALVVMADQEGGLVQRYRAPFTDWPGNMALGAADDPNLTYEMAAATAAELRSVGIHMNLAPVADVNNNPNNPVIGVRSFGEDVGAVSQRVAAAVRGYQEHGVLAAAKHFPGHGDTAVDSHHALPVIPHSLERLAAVELPPFQAAMEAGVAAVMAAHVNFPVLAPDGKPATLAPAVLTGLLREQLGYSGVIVTDAMEMAALAGTTGVEEGLIQAVLAGADALLLAESFAEQERYHAALVRAVEEGRISAERVEDAVRRLLTMKAQAGLLPDRSGTAGAMAPALAEAPQVVPTGWAEHRALAQRIADQAVTLVRNDAGLLPLRLDADGRILVVSPGRAPDGTSLGNSIQGQHANSVEVVVDRAAPTADEIEAVRSQLAGADVVIYGVSNLRAGHRALMEEVMAAGKPLVLVGLSEPYDLMQLPAVTTYVAAYGNADVQLRAVAPPLFGRRPFTGRLPVSIPGLYPVGHGLTGTTPAR